MLDPVVHRFELQRLPALAHNANEIKFVRLPPLCGEGWGGGSVYCDQSQRDFALELRNQATPAEKCLWHFLRAGKLGVKFRRQAAIGPYVVDFVCFPCRLIVELDGPQHVEDKGRDHDARRTEWLASRGFRGIRFRNHALDDEILQVVEEIQRALAEQQDT
jgi:very-short-patch-repair endonuclease